MNYLSSRIVPENRTVHKATSIAITALLVTSLFVGIIPVIPAVSAANMSVSQTRIGASNAIKITISDAALTNHPTVTLSWGTSQSQSLTNNMFRTPLGDWILFIANSTSTLPVNSTLRSPPSISNGSVTGTTGSRNNKTAITDGQRTLVETVAFVEGTAGVTSATLTYGERGESITLTLGNPAVSSAVAGRTTVPPSGILPVTVTNVVRNFDPTAKDGAGKFSMNFNYTKVWVAVNGANKTLSGTAGAGVPTGIGNATETAVGSGNFTLNVNLARYNVTNGDLVTVTVFDILNSALSTSVSVSVQSTNGVLSAPATVTYSQAINVTLTDADRNRDINTAETLTSGDINVVANIGGTSVKANVTLKETDKNTGIFYGTISVNINSTKSVSRNNSNSVIFGVTPGNVTSFTASYTDPVSQTVGHQSQATFTLAITTPTLAFTEPTSTFLPATSIPATLVLTNPNANDNTTVIERVTGTNASTLGLHLFQQPNNVKIARLNVTETKSGVTRTLSISDDIQFVETGLNTGIFNMAIDLATQLNGTRTAGSTLTFSYVDSFTGSTITITATIGGTLSTISIDRSTLPVAIGKSVYVTVNVNDPKANSNPSSINTATVRVTITNATNQRVAFKTDGNAIAGHTRNITLTETGVNTGIFNATIRYIILGDTARVRVWDPTAAVNYTLHNTDTTFSLLGANVTGRQMVNGKLVFTYADPIATGGTVSASSTITPSNDALSLSASSVTLNQSLTVTLTSADENANPNVKDTVKVSIFRNALTTKEGDLTLTETAVNSGVFTGSKRVGATGQTPFAAFVAGDTIKANFTDRATTTSYYGTGLTTASLSATATIPTNSAIMTLNAASYGPFSRVVINITDPDLVFSTAANVKLSLIQTSKVIVRDLAANSSLGGGKFQWSLQLTTGTTNLQTAAVDTLSVYFVDALDASGNAGVIVSQTAPVQSVTGALTLSPSTALVGQFINVTVSDSDQNKNSGIIEAVNVTITSTSWPIGQTVLIAETAANSGVFSAQVKIVSGIPATSNEIRGATGDTITAKYTDKTNATGLQSTVTATATVGTSQVPTQRVPASTPSIVDSSGNPVAAPTAGSLVVVQAAVKNNATTAQTVTYIVQVKNANGQVVFLNWIQNLNLAVGQTSTPGISWTPSAAGTYTIQVFVWDSLTGAQALSPVFTQTVTVS